MEEVTVVEVQPQKVIGMRKRGKYQKIGEMIRGLYQYAMAIGLKPLGPPVFVCHEAGMEEAMKADNEENADLEVVVPVEGEVEDTEEVKFYELPGGTMAKITHKGPYEKCTGAYEKLFGWIAANGKNIAGPTREIYLNDPRQTSPEELLTEIYVPVD
jgi:effector-binding domain-containing protein